MVSQEFLKPELKFSNACASDSFNSYEVEVTYISSIFNPDNVFTLEMSDANGDFTSPFALKTISNQNSSFRFTIDFEIPATTKGSNYKLRIASSSPAKISPESDSFEAYFMSQEQLILNDFNNITLCEGTSATIEISNASSNDQVQWYKDNQKLLLGNATLEVTEPGFYYGEIYYGTCNSSSTSNVIEVIVSPLPEAKIEGSSSVAVCKGESHTLSASVDNNQYSYKWFQNGEEITSLPSYSPILEITSVNESHSYSVEITNQNGCSSSSEIVTIEAIDTEFSLASNSSDPKIILTNETIELSINHDATNALIEWFKDGITIANSDSETLSVSESGIYHAEVRNSIGNCSTMKVSNPFVINAVNSFEVSINLPSTYSDCASNSVIIDGTSIVAKDDQNNSYTLTNNQLNLIEFTWKKDGITLQNNSVNQLTINDYRNNGNYELDIKNGSISTSSNILEVKLSLPPINLTSSDINNTFCPNKNITLSVDQIENINYQWILDGQPIQGETKEQLTILREGNYAIEANGFGCTTISDVIQIDAFDANDVVFDFDEIIKLEPGKTFLAVVLGGDSYEWFNDRDELISTDSSLEVKTEGEYRVVVNLNGCTVEKLFSVTIENLSISVPNSITPNGDGINDYWILPNDIAYQNDIAVEIYNRWGKPVLKKAGYENNWPNSLNLNSNQIFYFIIKTENQILKKGTITILR